MGRVAWVLVAALALATTGCAGAAKRAHARGAIPSAVSVNPDNHTSHGPFVATGGAAAGGYSGFWGDGTSSLYVEHLGCIPGRFFAHAVSLRNRTNQAVTVTAATGAPDRRPRIIRRVATQLRLARPGSAAAGDAAPGGLSFGPWSARPARPVTIPPGLNAVVQANFHMNRCRDLARGRTLVVPGELVLTYSRGGKAGQEKIASPTIILTRGPTTQPCAPVGGSSSILPAGINCRVARRAAIACDRLTHHRLKSCMSDGKLWDCASPARALRRRGWGLTEQCRLSQSTSPHWFLVSWWKHHA